MSDLMTLKELVAEAAVELSRASLDQPSGRVSEVPKTRTVRYYTTHGLIDRPAEFSGRTALYTRKHLMQLVAIKRLQAQGQTLVEIQERLLGLDDAGLARLAQMMPAAAPATTASREESRRAESFWTALPSDAPLEPPPPRAAPPAAPLPPGAVTGAALDAELTLLLHAPRRALTAEDIEALRAAAEPLLRVLKARHLT